MKNVKMMKNVNPMDRFRHANFHGEIFWNIKNLYYLCSDIR